MGLGRLRKSLRHSLVRRQPARCVGIVILPSTAGHMRPRSGVVVLSTPWSCGGDAQGDRLTIHCRGRSYSRQASAAARVARIPAAEGQRGLKVDLSQAKIPQGIEGRGSRRDPNSRVDQHLEEVHARAFAGVDRGAIAQRNLPRLGEALQRFVG